MDGSFERIAFKVDTDAKKATFSTYRRFAAVQPQSQGRAETGGPHLYLDVRPTLQGRFSRWRASSTDTGSGYDAGRGSKDFLLVQRGFHWMGPSPWSPDPNMRAGPTTGPSAQRPRARDQCHPEKRRHALSHQVYHPLFPRLLESETEGEGDRGPCAGGAARSQAGAVESDGLPSFSGRHGRAYGRAGGAKQQGGHDAHLGSTEAEAAGLVAARGQADHDRCRTPAPKPMRAPFPRRLRRRLSSSFAPSGAEGPTARAPRFVDDDRGLARYREAAR